MKSQAHAARHALRPLPPTRVSAGYRLGDDMGLGGGERDGRYARDLVPAARASEKVWIGGSAAVR